MNTQGTAYTEPNVPPVRKSTTDGRSPMDAGESNAPELKMRVRQMYEDGKTRMNAWKGGVQDSIREKPIQSVLIAAAVGAVIGVLVGRRTR